MEGLLRILTLARDERWYRLLRHCRYPFSESCVGKLIVYPMAVVNNDIDSQLIVFLVCLSG